jgi:uncharacterized protein (UPF0332 family)
MIEPLGYLDFAKEILDSIPITEIKIRTAVNRAYYAVYLYAADKYSQAKGNDPSIEAIIRSHARFIKELKLEASQPLQTLGNQLNDLKQDREKADYEYKANVSKNSAQKSYFQALHIKQTVDTAFSSFIG